MSWIGKKAADVVASGQQLANGTVSAIKLAAGAVVAHLGYTPANKAGDTFTGPIVGQNTGGSAVVSQATSAAGNASFKLVGATAQNRNWEIFQRYTNGDFGVFDGVAALDRLVLDTNGNLSLPTGNLVLASGKGIDFSANGNASGMAGELLDDYEHGAFTPTISGLTFAVAWGRYVKVGRMCFCSLILGTSNTSKTSQDINIEGLPFLGDNNGGYGANSVHICEVNAISFGTIGGTVANRMYGRINSATSMMQLLQSTGSTHDNFGIGGGIGSGGTIRVSFSYLTA